jgi:proteasome activator subunit 4
VNIAMNYFHTHFFDGIIQQLEQVYQSSKWHVRRAAISFVQNMVFSNLFNVRPYTKRLHTFVLKCLFDEQIEVRMVASTTLSGFYQCGYIQVIDDDLVRLIVFV